MCSDIKIVDGNTWFCPATESEIDEGLCWEYCFADGGGPVDTADELKRWIKESCKFKSLEEFHRVCDRCKYCQWSRV